jgi:hypothetical protein
VPLEVLVDYRCESNDFERLVPLTDATFEYDKFNRLRLRNKLSAVAVQGPGVDGVDDHLRNQTVRLNHYLGSRATYLFFHAFSIRIAS